MLIKFKLHFGVTVKIPFQIWTNENFSYDVAAFDNHTYRLT